MWYSFNAETIARAKQCDACWNKESLVTLLNERNQPPVTNY